MDGMKQEPKNDAEGLDLIQSRLLNKDNETKHLRTYQQRVYKMRNCGCRGKKTRTKGNIPEMFLLLKNQEKTNCCRWIGNVGE